MATRLNGKLQIAIGIFTLVGMLFGAWLFLDERHALAEDLDAETIARKYGDEVKALDAAQAVLETRIEQKEMALEDIEQRAQDGKALSSDVTRKARLERDLDKLLTRQDKLLDKQNSMGVIP